MAIRNWAVRGAVATALMLTACEEKPTDDTSDDDGTGNDITNVGTDSGDTGDCEFGDTGCIVSLSIVEQAIVDTDAGTYEGFEAATFRWIGQGWAPTVGGSSVCSLVRHTRDWASDDSRDGEDSPLSEAELGACTDCDFAFAVSATEGVASEELPWVWNVDADDTEDTEDTIVDFDPDNDWSYTFPDVDKRPVDCEAVGLTDLAPEDGWYGIGFKAATLDGVEAPSGAVMYWSVEDTTWVPLTGTSETQRGIGVYVEDEDAFLYELLSAYALVSQ